MLYKSKMTLTKSGKMKLLPLFICQFCKNLTYNKLSCQHENVFGSDLKIVIQQFCYI